MRFFNQEEKNCLRLVMRFCGRLFFFIAINFLVAITISLLLSFLGVSPYLTNFGINIRSLAIFCLAWGMLGALISLAFSRVMARCLMRIQIVDPQKASGMALQLVQIVERLSFRSGLLSVPQVGIFNSSQMNAFATGPTRKRSLVAVSTALLEEMDSSELEAVIAHEIAHITNGDMVTMTLIQGVVNAFVMFLSRILAYGISSVSGSQNRRVSHFTLYGMILLFEFLFMIFGSMAIAFFSRRREFRADRGGATLSSKEKMIRALQHLKENANRDKREDHCAALNGMMICKNKTHGLFNLFSTHPTLDQRIKRLKNGI